LKGRCPINPIDSIRLVALFAVCGFGWSFGSRLGDDAYDVAKEEAPKLARTINRKSRDLLASVRSLPASTGFTRRHDRELTPSLS
jgi:hypothetical protein